MHYKKIDYLGGSIFTFIYIELYPEYTGAIAANFINLNQSLLCQTRLMDNDKLIAVFEMLCDRLGRVEEGVHKNTESLKESQRTRLGRSDSHLFGWKSDVYREPDLDRDPATFSGHVTSLSRKARA